MKRRTVPPGEKDLPERAAPEIPHHEEEGLAGPYLDKTALMDGWPGHRTQPGKSSLDPLENDFEAAHMTGVFFRNLLIGRLRTRNPIYLALLLIIGLFCLAPLALSIYEAVTGNASSMQGWPYMVPLALVGVLLLANFGLSLLDNH